MIKKVKKKKHRILKIVLMISLLFLVSLFLYLFYLTKQTNYDDSKDKEIQVNEDTNEEMEGFINIAIFGVDSRENQLVQDTRSDAIMIASINNQTKDVKLCSIYRDTYLHLPGHGFDKINHAYFYGGYSLGLSTINMNLDLDIKNYVTLNFKSVVKVIDSLGGITLKIKKNELEYLNGYVREINRVNNTSIKGLKKAGKQKVNGTQALAYARIRFTSGGDFKRAKRQRVVVKKVLKKAKTLDMMTLNQMIHDVLPEIYTNLDSGEILSLAKNILSYRIADQTGFPFTKETPTIDNTSYVTAINLSANVSRLHEYLFDTADYTPSEAVQTISDEIEKVR